METLLAGITSITMGQIVMMLIGAVLIYLGIKKEYEPTLLVPMGLGTILVNFPGTGVLTQMVNGSESEGVLDVLPCCLLKKSSLRQANSPVLSLC